MYKLDPVYSFKGKYYSKFQMKFRWEMPRAAILSSVREYLTQLLSHREYARNANVIQPCDALWL